MNQKNVLSVLGCSGSLALAVAFASPAAASPMMAQGETDPFRAEAAVTMTAQGSGNTLRDALGCGCATCQASQRQTLF